MRIGFFEMNGQFQILQRFRTGLQHALKDLSVDNDIISIKGVESFPELLERLKKKKYDATFGFNSMLTYDKAPNYTIPHVMCIVDPVCYHQNIFHATTPLIVFSVGEDSVQLLHKQGVKHAYLFPHAIEASYLTEKNRSHKRTIDVLFPALFADPEEQRAPWKEHLTRKSYEILDEFLNRCMTTRTSILFAAMDLLQDHPELQEEIAKFNISLCDVLLSLHDILRAEERVRLLESLKGQNMLIVGNARPGIKARFPSYTFKDPVNFTRLLQLMRQSRLVINSCYTFNHALHERLLYALGSGASCLTFTNEYVTAQFPNSLAVPCISTPTASPESLISGALSSEEARMNAVAATIPTILANHTWNSRAQFLITCLEKFR